MTPDHTVQNLLFLHNAFLTSEGEMLGLMLESLSCFTKGSWLQASNNLGARICFVIYNLLIKWSINCHSLSPCTSHFSFTRQWVRFSFQKSVFGEDKRLAAPLAYQVLTGLVRTHVRRPVCLRLKNAMNWSGLIGTQNFVILEILRWELAYPLFQAESRAKDPDFLLKAAFCIVLSSPRTTGCLFHFGLPWHCYF